MTVRDDTVNLFSMSAVASLDLDKGLLARFGVLQGTEALLPDREVLGLGWPELERVLPDHGLPRGVIEIAAMPRLNQRTSAAGAWLRGGATTIAIAALKSLHASDAQAWAAWITPAAPGGPRVRGGDQGGAPPLYAPALAQAGVDLDRLLVVRPAASALARTVVKVAASGAFGLVIVDAPHRQDLGGGVAVASGTRAVMPRGGDASAVVVRKLALAAEESGTTTLLLTSGLTQRATPWPVALRLEVERRPEALSVRVTKDRRGAGSSPQLVRLAG